MPCHQQHADPCRAHPQPPESLWVPPQKHVRETDRCSPSHAHIQVHPPGRSVTQRDLSQLVCCPGPSVSGFPALHNLSIRAKYICHFPLPGDREMSRLFQTGGEEECYETKRRPGTVEMWWGWTRGPGACARCVRQAAATNPSEPWPRALCRAGSPAGF